ncbi:Perlucin-like protein [Holothuria leucospilota]|uniref:Perlucin-like protein n=1 Tax=Holothuria leucospilota TaxID=206669 RepID=A0A9Q1GWA0_HOLLE|nr:Perlucin-like protein [Holothuria leucospilota]
MKRKMVQKEECVFLLVVKLLQIISYVAAVCPNGWETWTSSTQVQKCFRFESSIGTYSDAQTFCQNNGGEIVNIDSSEENDYIFDQIAHMLQSSTYPGYNSFWLGADSLATSEGYYKFVNSLHNGYDPTHWWDPAASTGIGYWNWWPGEPAHVGTENCAVMQGTYNKQWSDEDCESTVFVRSAACQLVGSGTAVSTIQTTSDDTTSPSTMQTTTASLSTKVTTTDSTTKITAQKTTSPSTTKQLATTTSLQSTQQTNELSNSGTSEYLFSLAGEFVRKGQVCLLNFGLETITTTSLNRCAGRCVRHETCVSFSFISLSQENQCMLYSVSKDFGYANLTYELSPGLNCLYYERR